MHRCKNKLHLIYKNGNKILYIYNINMYRKLLQFSKKKIPRISETERIALNSGTKGIEELFFKGTVSQKDLIEKFPYPKIN